MLSRARTRLKPPHRATARDWVNHGAIVSTISPLADYLSNPHRLASVEAAGAWVEVARAHGGRTVTVYGQTEVTADSGRKRTVVSRPCGAQGDEVTDAPDLTDMSGQYQYSLSLPSLLANSCRGAACGCGNSHRG